MARAKQLPDAGLTLSWEEEEKTRNMIVKMADRRREFAEKNQFILTDDEIVAHIFQYLHSRLYVYVPKETS